MKHTSKSHLKDFIELLLAEGLLAGHQVHSKEEHQQAMAHISKHDGKQEWEGDDGEDRWVDLSVAGYAIGMNNLLEGAVDLVCLKIGWGRLVGHQRLKDGPHLQKTSLNVIISRNEISMGAGSQHT